MGIYDDSARCRTDSSSGQSVSYVTTNNYDGSGSGRFDKSWHIRDRCSEVQASRAFHVELRTYGTHIFVTPADQDVIKKFGGPTGPLSVSDYGDEKIQETKGFPFDIYRFPTTQDAFGFGIKTMGVTISFPAGSGGSCP
jgi:hypothetical protein